MNKSNILFITILSILFISWLLFVIHQFYDIYKIKKSDRHTANSNAFITALLFLKLKKKLEI